MSKTKESKDGWIRHRGGKCPVETGVLVDVRYRDGSVNLSVPAKVFGATGTIERSAVNWSQSCGRQDDIMAYRISEPVLPITDDACIDLCVACAEDEQASDPLVWRDRIYELAAQQEEITEIYNRQSSEIAAERDSLINRLESEGFRLIDGPVETATHAEDMSDWRNWKVGDNVRLFDGGCDTSSMPGGEVGVVSAIESDDPRGQYIEVDECYWPMTSRLSWVSRPSA